MKKLSAFKSERFLLYTSVRSFIYLLFYAFLHFLYEWIPYFPFNIVSGTSESVFQHLKIGFFSYLILILVEYAIFRKNIKEKQHFIIARLFSTILIPYWIFLFWYIVPGIYNKEFPSIGLELGYAFLITYIVAFISSYIDREFEKHETSRSFKILIGIFLIVSLFIFTLFSLRLPWLDLFAEP